MGFPSSKRTAQKPSFFFFFAKFDSWTGLEGEFILNIGKNGDMIRKKSCRLGYYYSFNSV